MRLTILHFNDLHARLEQLPRLFTLIQRERAEATRAGRQLLLLDGGDLSDASRWESDVTQGRANFSLLEAMGVQASVLGNGEAMTWGRAALARLVASVHFPVLAANLVDSDDADQLAVPRLLGSTVLEAGGLPVGVAGLTPIYAGYYERFGYCSSDPAQALRREIDLMRQRGARLLILLSHLGVVLSPDVRSGWMDPQAWTDDEVPIEFPEIAVIVGGHTHTALAEPLTVRQTIIVQAGSYGSYLGRLDLEVDDATGAVTAYAGRLIPCGADVPLDPTIQGTLELVIEEAGRIRQGASATRKG